MSFFVDANVFIYTVTDDPRKSVCLEIMRAVAEGADGHTSVAALEEVWHFELSSSGPEARGLTHRALVAFTPVLEVSEEMLKLAMALQTPPALGANDRLHVATCMLQGIETIVTADRDFDALDTPGRIDPLDAAGVEELLGP